MKNILDAIPSNWCDPLLTGDNKVVGDLPYNCQDIENLLNGIRERIKAIVSYPTVEVGRADVCACMKWEDGLIDSSKCHIHGKTPPAP